MSNPCILVYSIPSGGFTLTLPLYGGTTSSINWGDGNTTTDDVRNHVYGTSGNYTVQIIGSGITSMNQTTNGANTARWYLTECQSFGEIGLTSLEYAFWNCTALTVVPALLPTTSNITIMSHTFDEAYVMNSNLTQWDVSYAIDMTAMFLNAQAFNNGDSGNNGANPLNWGNKTQNVTSMQSMFNTAVAFNQRIDSFNVSSVTSMDYMFNSTSIFNNGDTGNNQAFPIAWGSQTSNILSMSGMFSNAYSFNQNIGGWSTGACINMDQMFYNATLFNQNIGSWNVANVTNMNSMFSSANAFNQNLGSWNVFNVTNMSNMFSNTAAFNNGDSGNNQAYPLVWSTDNVLDMDQMFNNASVFNQNIGTWDVALVQDMNNMFRNAYLFNQDLNAWNTSSVTTMYRMFRNATAFNNGDSGNNQTKPLTGWAPYLGSVEDMGQMFRDTPAFNQNVGNWDISNVLYFNRMFDNAALFNQNLSAWNPANADSISDFLSGCPSFSITNYDALLVGWSQRTLPSGLWFGNEGRVYSSAGAAARHLLETNFNWNIEGDIFTSVNPVTSNTNITFRITGNQSAMFNNLNNGNDYELRDINNNPISGSVTLTNTETYPALEFTNVTFSTTGTQSFNLYDVTDDYTPYGYPYIVNVTTGMPCFKEGSKILTADGYRPIESLRKGDRIQTVKHGFRAIEMIGKRVIEHIGSTERVKNQLYVCKPSQYPDLTEDLVITGCHSLLVTHFKEGEKEATAKVLGANYVTDGHYRLPACVDQRTEVYDQLGNHTIYHLALENRDHFMNYGIYANGLLVESTSMRYMKRLSGMTIIE